MKSNNKVDPNDIKSNSNIDYVESAYLKDFNGVSSSLSSGNGIFEKKSKMAGVLLYFMFLGGLINSGVSKSGLNKAKVADDDGSSDDGTSSLEESVEEHKQPQTEEIMNAELIAGVN